MTSSARARPPVLFIAFNRPGLTAQTFERIRRAAPTQLFVALDGPRDRDDERARCAEVETLVRQVDWDCEVKFLVRAENLGCKAAVSGAIHWFFDHVEAGVIIEDDCLISDSFLPYCADLLERYADDDEVWMVSGTNLLKTWHPDRSSYFFGESGVWGWATWRRAWRHADIELSSWNDSEARMRAATFFGKAQWRTLQRRFHATSRGLIDTWDYGWSFTRASHGGLGAIPGRNLVTNIGFDADATHTTAPSPFADIPALELDFPLVPPAVVQFDRGYQRRVLLREAASAIRTRLGPRASRR